MVRPDLTQLDLTIRSSPLIAKFRPVLWEALPGTGERLIALLALEPHERTERVISAATYCIISDVRLRQLLGRQRGTAAAGVLRQCAAYMTQRQQAGLPLDELRPLFHGFELSSTLTARGETIEQLIDAAVKSVSVFGSADEILDEEEVKQSHRHTVRTAEFLRGLRRVFLSFDQRFASYFDVHLQQRSDLPEVVVDYADGPLVVQATSLPATAKQAENTEREAQAKLFQLSLTRQHMGENRLNPFLLINTDALEDGATSEARRHAEHSKNRLIEFSRAANVRVLSAPDPDAAAHLLRTEAIR